MIDAAGAVCRGDGPGQMAEMRSRFVGGDATVDHVVAVVRLLDKPAARELTPAQRDEVQARLARLTVSHNPRELRAEGERLLAELVPVPPGKPPVNELRITALPGGGARISGTIADPFDAELLQTIMDAKSAPLSSDDARPLPQRQGDALLEVFQYVSDHGDNDDLPSTGGNRSQVIVTFNWEDLRTEARAATLNGIVLDPASGRKACCEAEIIPIVLGGDGQALDAGQSRRAVRSGMRHLVTLRDGGCAHPGCDRKPGWCHVHHIHEWAKGGKTTLDNLVMLCRSHHRLHHATEWRIRIAPDGLPEFVPPVFIDPEQRPRRHARRCA